MTDDRRAGSSQLHEMVARIDERTQSIDERTDRIERALFVGNGQTALVSRVAVLEERGAAADKKVAATWGGAGTAIGAAIVALLAYFGIGKSQ